MEEAVGLQVLHALADVVADAEQVLRAERTSALTDVIQETAELHELRHQVDGPLLRTHTI